MSEWRLPKLKEDKHTIVQSRYAVNNIDNVAGILTCLSIEARKNDLGSMAFVLMELADELGKSTEKLDTFVRWQERQEKEKNNEKD